MTPEEVRDKIFEGRTLQPNLIMDRAVVMSSQFNDDSGIFLRAHRKVLALPSVSKSIATLVEQYNYRKQVIDYADIGLSVAAQIAKDALSIRPLGKGLYSHILIGAAKAAASVAVDRVKANLVNDLNSNNAHVLGSRLEYYFSRHGNFNNFYNPANREAAIRELGLKEIYETGHKLPGLDSAAQAQVVKQIVNRLSDAIANHTLDNLRGEKVQDEELKRLAGEDLKIWTALKRNGEQTAAHLNELHACVTDLRKELDATTRRSLQNEADIHCLALVISESLPPVKQKELIELGLLEVPQAKRAEIIESLDRRITLQKRIDTISNVLNEGHAIVSIMNDLKVDPKIAEPVGKVVKIGAAALNAYLNFQTGNIFAGVAAVTGLFGGGSSTVPDPKIVAMLDHITNKVEEIDRKLEQIIKIQKHIFDKIEELSDSLEKKYESLSSDILINRSLIVDSEMSKLRWLEQLTKDCTSGSIVIDYRTSRFPNYQEIYEIQRRTGLIGNSPEWGFFDIFNLGEPQNEISPRLLVDAHLTEHSELKRVKETYNKIHALFVLLSKKLKYDPDRTLACAMMPTDKIRYVNIKQEELKKQGEVGLLKIPYGTSLTLLSAKQIHIGFLIRAIEALLNTHFLSMAFHRNESRLLTEEELLKGGLSTRGQQWLLLATRILDIAILQQSLLSGDVLLFLLYELFNGTLAYPSESDPDYDLKMHALTVIKENDMLRRNVGLYFVRQRVWTRVKIRDKVHLLYRVMLDDPSIERKRLHGWLGTIGPNQNCSGQPLWNLKRYSEGQFIEIRDDYQKEDKSDGMMIRVPLPPSERIADEAVEQLYLPRSIRQLIELRKALQEHADSYTLSETLLKSEGGKDAYFAMVFLQA